MSKRTGFRFHTKTTHGPPASPTGPPKPDLEPVKQPNSHETSANYGGRSSGFPNSMFQKCEMNSTVITDGGWVRPSPTGWSLPPDASASNNERSPVVIAGGGNKWGWGSGHASPAVKKATGKETIDSSEAAKKYGGRLIAM